MAAEKTLGLITRVIEFSESSCVVTLFTEDFGKVAALAKGARRPKSAFEGAIDLLALVRIVFLHKSSDSLDLLTEARLERRFRSATRDLARLYAGYYVAEIMNEMTDHGDPHPRLFRAADSVLQALDLGESPAGQVLWLEMNALGELGQMPSLRECVGCSRDIGDPPRASFGMLAGGVLCPRCRVGQRHVVSVSLAGLRTLRDFAGAWRAGRPAPEGPPTAVRGEVRGLMNQFLANLWGKKPRMHRYLSALGK